MLRRLADSPHHWDAGDARIAVVREIFLRRKWAGRESVFREERIDQQGTGMARVTIDGEELLARFIRYVQVDTTADDHSESYPSSAGQWDLGKILVEELLQLGVTDAHQDSYGLVWGTVPATQGGAGPVLAFNAHVDTSPETTGKGVKPQILRGYDGKDIALPGDPSKVIRVSENPELAGLVGKTLVTTDGTTLLGSDDKSGVAVIMQLVATLMRHREIPVGTIKVLFTCDEEIGQGIKHVDLAKLGATVCYTLDGGGQDEIDTETFSADMAIVTFKGINIHPSIGKGKMINAIRGAGHFIDLLPREGMSPETTDDRQGFLHPYQLEGGVAEAKLKVLIRDFATEGLTEKGALLRTVADETQKRFPGLKVNVQIVKQYRNLSQGLALEPRAVDLAVEAHRRLGRTAKKTIVRGGTDGSQLTEKGLPTPNLSTGEHNPHSPLEWTCLEEMVAGCEVLVELSQCWGEQKGA